MTEARLWAAERRRQATSGRLRTSLRRTRAAADPVTLALVALLVVMAILCGFLVANGLGLIALGLAAAIPVGVALLMRPFLGIIVWILLMPYFFGEPNSLNVAVLWIGHRLLIPVMLLLVAIYHWSGLRRSPFRLHIMDIALVAFLVLGVLNVLLLSDSTQRMLVGFHGRIAVPIMIFWLIRAIGLNARDLRWLVAAGFITIASQVAIGWLSWTAPGILPSDWLGRAGERTTGTFASPAPYTATLIFFSFLLLHHVRTHSVGSLVRVSAYGAIAAALTMVLLSLSRGSWLGAGAALAGLALLYPRVVVRVVPLLVVAGLVVMLSPLGQQLSVAQERLGETATVEGRAITNDAAMQMIQQQPLLGWGYGNFELFDEQFKRPVGGAQLRVGGSAHQTYLAFAAENGLVAFILYFVPVLGLGYWSIRRWRDEAIGPARDQALLALLWLALLDQFLVSNFMDMMHSSAWGVGLWWLTLGLIAVLVLPNQRITTR